MSRTKSTRDYVVELRDFHPGMPAFVIRQWLKKVGVDVSRERIRQILKTEGLPTRVDLKAWATKQGG